MANQDAVELSQDVLVTEDFFGQDISHPTDCIYDVFHAGTSGVGHPASILAYICWAVTHAEMSVASFVGTFRSKSLIAHLPLMHGYAIVMSNVHVLTCRHYMYTLY